MNDNNAMKDLENTINEYFKRRKEVVAVYLFGSHAAGKQRAFSDIDIGVLLHQAGLPQTLALQNRYTRSLGRQLRKDIHTVILNSAGETLLKQIFNKGILVCVNDQAIFKQFRMTRYSMIAEFGYYLDMTQNGFIRSLLEGHSSG